MHHEYQCDKLRSRCCSACPDSRLYSVKFTRYTKEVRYVGPRNTWRSAQVIVPHNHTVTHTASNVERMLRSGVCRNMILMTTFEYMTTWWQGIKFKEKVFCFRPLRSGFCNLTFKPTANWQQKYLNPHIWGSGPSYQVDRQWTCKVCLHCPYFIYHRTGTRV